MKIFVRVSILTFATALMMASGTYRPPKAPKGMKFDKKTIAAGKKLFEKSSFGGAAGRTCVSCHTKKGREPFRRSSLKKSKSKLFASVQACVTHDDRVASKKLKPGSKESFQLGAYLVSRYRLPYDQLDAFVEEPKE